MALPRSVRLLAALTLGLFLYMMILIFRAPAVGRHVNPYVKDTSWREPNLDLIDEPPEPLVRVNGNNYAPDNPNSDRIPATIMSLVRNSELDQLLQSMRDLERTFNHKFNYPWTFFNDEPFTTDFKKAVRAETKAAVHFELVPREHWEVPPWINQDLYTESTKILREKEVQYADKISYHQMCRWNSGLFPHHPALKDLKYYWRIEPNVHFFCDIDYDVFRFMESHNKTYGFTINLYDAPATVPSLWPETQRWLAEEGNQRYVHPNNAEAWVRDASHRPEHNRKANGYSTCHFWSNFEIGSLDFWRSDAYTSYFKHLDRAGGFFYERWGDAPVHSIALGLLEDKEKIHWFRDIGYQHIPFFNCPRRRGGKCKGCEEALLTDGEKFLYKEDCRPSWFQHVGYGEWEKGAG